MKRSLMPKLMILFLLTACSKQTTASEPDASSHASRATPSCYILAEITFWESTAHLSNIDKERADKVIKFAREISEGDSSRYEEYIAEARARGMMSHGNSGAGLHDFEAAREDALEAALMTLSLCLDGKLEGYARAKNPENWWLDK